MRIPVLALLAACVMTACASDPNMPLSSPTEVEQIGTGQFMISCFDSPGSCRSQANVTCPAGFELVNAVENPGGKGFTMTVRCS